MGQDLLNKFQEIILFSGDILRLQLGGSARALTNTWPINEEYFSSKIQPIPSKGNGRSYRSRKPLQFWAEDNPLGLVKHVSPVIVWLTSGAMSIESSNTHLLRSRKEVKVHIGHLFEASMLISCQLVWNTPSCLSKSMEPKMIDQYEGSEQMGRNINSAVTIPYTLLSLLEHKDKVYIVLPLKDAFFSISLSKSSQLVFTFELTNPKLGISGQLTWTRLL